MPGRYKNISIPPDGQITQSLLKEILLYDQDTGLFTWKISAGRKIPGDIAGNETPNGYVRISINGRSYWAHHLAWLYVTGKFSDLKLFHLNKLTTDNRFCNLVEATSSHLAATNKLSTRNTSGFKGVHYHKKRNRYIAVIVKNGITYQLGSFHKVEQAHQAYSAASLKLYGIFSRPSSE